MTVANARLTPALADVARRSWRRIVPARVRSEIAPGRRAVEGLGRRVLLAVAVRSLKICHRRGRQPRLLIQAAVIGWGNPRYRPSVGYATAVVSAAAVTPGAIVECGSGLTTLLSRIVAPESAAVVTLENDRGWADTVRQRLVRFGLGVDGVIHAPLVDCGGYDWYSSPILPDEVGLVICDGPPADGEPPSTKGGRYGAGPATAESLSHGAVILLDDCHRLGELQVLHRWQTEFGWTAELAGSGPSQYAIVHANAARPDRASPEQLPGG